MRRSQEVPESDANETIQAIYADIKSTLCVTYVPAFFRALATNGAFVEQMWRSLEPTLTIHYVRAADDLRAAAVDLAGSLDDELGLPQGQPAEQQIDGLWVVHFIAPKTLLAAATLEGALTSGSTGADSRVVWPQNTGVPRGMPLPAFIHPEAANGTIGTTYGDITETLKLPVLTDEWRALAASAETLRSAWHQVRGLSDGDAYPKVVDELTDAARDHGRKLPRRVLDLDAATLRNQGIDESAQQSVRETVSAFVPALARETIHTSLWLSQLTSPDEAQLTGLQLLRRWTVPHGYRTDTVLT